MIAAAFHVHPGEEVGGCDCPGNRVRIDRVEQGRAWVTEWHHDHCAIGREWLDDDEPSDG